MTPFISVLSFQTSVCSGENLAGGLLAVSNNKIFFKTSDFKLKIAEMICGQPYKTTVTNILSLIQSHIDKPMAETPKVFSAEYVKYLNKYSNGVLQFSDPKQVATEIDEALFENLFLQFTGDRSFN